MKFFARLFSRTKNARMRATHKAPYPYATISTVDGFREMTRTEVDAELIAPMTECTALLERTAGGIERQIVSGTKLDTSVLSAKAHQILAAAAPLCRSMSDALMSMSFESDAAAEQDFAQHVHRLFHAQSSLSQAIKRLDKESDRLR